MIKSDGTARIAGSRTTAAGVASRSQASCVQAHGLENERPQRGLRHLLTFTEMDGTDAAAVHARVEELLRVLHLGTLREGPADPRWSTPVARHRTPNGERVDTAPNRRAPFANEPRRCREV